MKTFPILLLISIAFVSCDQPARGRNGVSFKNASQYNDYIVNRQSSVIKNVMDFVRISESSLDSADHMLDMYAAQMDTIIEEISAMPPYKGDSALREAAISSFGFYKRLFTRDYKEYISIRKQGGLFTEEGVDSMNQIVDRITKEEVKYDKAFQNAQHDFALKNNMKLKENEMQKEFDKLNKEYQ